MSIDPTKKQINLVGYGTYEGEKVPKIFKEDQITNPMIRLDNGKIVWGMQVWWDSENAVKSQIERKVKNEGYKVVEEVLSDDDCIPPAEEFAEA